MIDPIMDAMMHAARDKIVEQVKDVKVGFEEVEDALASVMADMIKMRWNRKQAPKRL